MILLGLLFLLCIWLGRRERGKEPLTGEKITVEDVKILMQALDISLEGLSVPERMRDDSTEGQKAQEDMEGEDSAGVYLTYGQYIEICGMINGEEMALPDYSERYEEDHAMLKADWYTAFRRMLAYMDQDSSVWETTVFLLKTDAQTDTAYTESGGMQTPYRYHSQVFEQNILHQLKAYVKGSELLTVTEVLPEEHELKNVWIMEAANGRQECFYHQVAFHAEAEQAAERESVADLTFRDGRIVAARTKKEKLHGKLLRMTTEEMEIEDLGTYRISEDMEVYKLYGSLETKARSDLRIGYADTDFVVEKGQICAALISEEEAADRIRVLLKNTANGANYHDSVELTVDEETIQVNAEELKAGERRVYQCAALTDKILLNMEGSTKEDNAYRGKIECFRTEDGMVIINELPLEEYLYAVVPSEMPASYPLESLKAQAVCARTYAYRYILHAGLPEVGAHVDDTTGYQVYHNIRENAATTTAVKETDGVLLTWQGEPAQNYYYSTSCGVGTDARIWRAESGQDISYLQSVRLSWDAYGKAGESVNAVDTELEDNPVQTGSDTNGLTERVPNEMTPEDLREEENFYRFIMAEGENDLEKEEPWHRWKYQVEELDEEIMLARIKERYASNPSCVLTKTEGEYYVSEPVENLEEVKELSIVKRGAGGVAEELVITGDSGTYKIISEYNIRYILCDGVSEAVKQDDSAAVPSVLLPSGFFVLQTGKSDGNVVGYTLTGGGYGHGAGMSQNGAKALGKADASYRDILSFFFPGCELTG